MMVGMTTKNPTHEETFRRIKEVRAQAIEYTRRARQLAAERRELMQRVNRRSVRPSRTSKVLRHQQSCVRFGTNGRQMLV